jgi:hypothetical protein
VPFFGDERPVETQPMHPTALRRKALLLIIASMLATVAGLRLYLHLIKVQHVYVSGQPFHHLFTGALIVIAAAFSLRARRRRQATLLALGSGVGMILDEVVFLTATDWSDAAYCGPASLWGAVVLVGLAAGLLLFLSIKQPRPRSLDGLVAGPPQHAAAGLVGRAGIGHNRVC